MANKKWDDLTDAQKTAVLTVASVELALTATALVDLVRRPADQVRGRKAVWGLVVLLQPIGPVAYLAWGRHTPRAL
jgi:hypothetical protein